MSTTIKLHLLCKTTTTGGVIGHSGTIVKRLERETSTRIQIDPPVSSSSSSKERLIHICGSPIVDRKLRLSVNGDEVEVEVSSVQEGLIKVFERMLEIEPELRSCRLVVGPGSFDEIFRDMDMGVVVKGFRLPLPFCVQGKGFDQVVEISGDSIAVMKALVVISQNIQEKTTLGTSRVDKKASISLRPSKEVQRAGPDQNVNDSGWVGTGQKLNGPGWVKPHLDRPKPKPSPIPIPETEDTRNEIYNRSIKMESSDSTLDFRANEDVVVEVVFKLLCTNDMAGYVIGYKGKKVKSFQEETKASIKFSALDDNCDERVAIISAFENRKSQNSRAQNALVRVYNETMSSRQKDNASARLLVKLSQPGWLDFLRNSIIGYISDSTGAKLELLEQKHALVGVSSDEKVLQLFHTNCALACWLISATWRSESWFKIDGNYPNVKTALFEVSRVLRESAFHTILVESNVSLLPHRAVNLSPIKEITSLTKNTKSFIVNKVESGSLKSNVPLSKFSNQACLSTSMDPRDLTKVKGGLAHVSGNKSVTVTNTKVEIAVRGDVFTSVFSDDGSKLSRIRTISGANVEVQAPYLGSDGRVVISGTSEQTLAAQSLLQAFIITAL